MTDTHHRVTFSFNTCSRELPPQTREDDLYTEQETRITDLAEKNAHLAVQNVGLQGALDQARLDIAELQTVLAGTRMLLENLTAKHAEQMARAERAEATVEKLTETLRTNLTSAPESGRGRH